MQSLFFCSASRQKTYKYFSGRSSRLTNGDRQVSAGAVCLEQMTSNPKSVQANRPRVIRRSIVRESSRTTVGRGGHYSAHDQDGMYPSKPGWSMLRRSSLLLDGEDE